MNETPDRSPISFDAFRVIIAEKLEVDEDDVVAEADFVEHLLAYSIRLVEMMLRMEELGVEIPIEGACEMRTVGDASRLYRRHAGSESRGRSVGVRLPF